MDRVKELNAKQIAAIRDSTARLNFLHGAVRSGKTIAFNLRWLEFVVNGPPGNLLMVGKTERTLKRNVLDPLGRLLGNEFSFNMGTGECRIGNRQIYVVGAHDERAQENIQGITLVGAFGDEVALWPETFFMMLLSRLSEPGAKFFGAFNSQGPYHYLKKDFIDKKDRLDLYEMGFEIDDNPTLDPKYVESLKKEYTGVFYQRNILGKWVLAEGVIYDMWDEGKHFLPIKGKDSFPNYIVACDYGTSNPCTFGLYGYDDTEDGLPAYLVKEYYYDSKVAGRQKTDSEYGDDFDAFLRGVPMNLVRAIYVDPSALSFIVELRQRGYKIKPAKNDVLEGIRFVSGLLKNDGFFIDQSCEETPKGYSSYVWDQNAQKRGEDAPMKVNDHTCFAAGTLISTKRGKVPIEQVVVGDFALTRSGYKLVTDAWMTSPTAETYEYSFGCGKVRCTPGHKVITSRGRVPIKSLQSGDSFFVECGSWEKLKSVISKALSIDGIQNLSGELTGFTFGLRQSAANVNHYIGICGLQYTGQFLPATMFTIKTVTPQTTTRQTSNSNMVASIFQTILRQANMSCLARLLSSLQKIGILPQPGTSQSRVKHGSAPRISDVLMKDCQYNTPVSYAETTSRQKLLKLKSSFVRTLASLGIGGQSVQILSQSSVSDAEWNSKQTNSRTAGIVQKVVAKRLTGKNLKVEPVYNITVAEVHEYFANGLLVANCDRDRYALFSHFYKKHHPTGEKQWK